MIFVLVSGYRKIEKFDEMVENCYADTDRRSLRRVKTVLGVFVVISVVSFIANIIGRHCFGFSNIPVAIPSILFSTLLFLLLYIGHKQDFTIADLIRENQPESVTPLTDSTINSTLQQIEEDMDALMQQEKIFLLPDLRINDLAIRLHTNREYIYQVLRHCKGASFAEYINRQRIDYVITLLKEDPSAPATETCIKAGYTSQSSYFRNFKRFTGMTPREYLQKKLQRDDNA